MEIRLGTLEDVEGIYQLECISFADPWSRKVIEEEFHNPQANYLLAIEEGKIIGYVGVWVVFEEGQITNVAVHKDYRQRGIGAKLIEAMMTFGEAKGIAIYFLEVRESNAAAIGLYEKCGFKMSGRRKKFYTTPTEDALLMSYEVQ